MTRSRTYWSTGVKISLGIYPNETPADFIAGAKPADEMGYSTLWVLDSHLLFHKVYGSAQADFAPLIQVEIVGRYALSGEPLAIARQVGRLRPAALPR
jgi:hypothetical protein